MPTLTRYSCLLEYASHLMYDGFGILTLCVRKTGIFDVLRTQTGLLGFVLRGTESLVRRFHEG